MPRSCQRLLSGICSVPKGNALPPLCAPSVIWAIGIQGPFGLGFPLKIYLFQPNQLVGLDAHAPFRMRQAIVDDGLRIGGLLRRILRLEVEALKV